MRFKGILLAVSLLFAACGQQEAGDAGTTNERKENPLDRLQEQINELRLTQDALNAVVNSDFKDCTGSASYATDKLTNRICQIAQASEAETREEMRGQIEHYAQSLEGELNAMDQQVASLQVQVDALPDQSEFDALEDDIADVQADITTLQGQVSTLQGQMTTANNAISALQTLTNSLNNTLANAFAPVEIGTELLSAGPLYESVLRTTDKLLVHSFVIAEQTSKTIQSNGCQRTNGTPTIQCTISAHGYLTGDLVRFSGLTGGGNVTNADMYGEFVVTVLDANTLTVTISKNATSGGSFGGSAGIATKVIARGMSRIWQSSDPSDSAVRVAVGSRPFNFIIKKGLTGALNANQGFVCYSTTNRQATFATINAATAVGMNGVINCK
jgi:prefoldin subunit 5